MKVIVDEKKLDDIFGQEAAAYAFEHIYMHQGETLEQFKKTKRYEMLQHFRQSLRAIKDRLRNC